MHSEMAIAFSNFVWHILPFVIVQKRGKAIIIFQFVLNVMHLTLELCCIDFDAKCSFLQLEIRALVDSLIRDHSTIHTNTSTNTMAAAGRWKVWATVIIVTPERHSRDKRAHASHSSNGLLRQRHHQPTQHYYYPILARLGIFVLGAVVVVTSTCWMPETETGMTCIVAARLLIERTENYY